ncbi:PilZ domain-containing protein [Altererythrobacter sp. GH1-8]|uniref:PilZ domain-containing protein n=1 Tax=Altererythrobacter sp. GH1-8 TaxID=3349333 RepID=UPI00374D5BE6
MTDARNLARENLFLLADLWIESEPGAHRIKVRNLSAGGMMGEGRVPVVRGHHIRVNLAGAGEVQGTVAWVQQTRFGVAFDNEVDLSGIKSETGGA